MALVIYNQCVRAYITCDTGNVVQVSCAIQVMVKGLSTVHIYV